MTHRAESWPRKWAGWTTAERVRIYLAGVILSPAIWRKMCDRGFCPRGIHAQVEAYRARGIEI